MSFSHEENALNMNTLHDSLLFYFAMAHIKFYVFWFMCQ